MGDIPPAHGSVDDAGMKGGFGHILEVLFSTSWPMTIEPRGEKSS